MSKIGNMMDMGKRAMMNNQTALQTTSHNIANKTTEGYSRQRVELQANTPIQYGNLQLGTGNRAAQVTRTNNPYIEKQLQKENGQLGFFNSQAELLSRVEQVFNEQSTKGLNQYMGDFFNAFRELANNPESSTTRALVKESAQSLQGDFARVNLQLGAIQHDVDEQIKSEVASVNKITKEIGALNQEISRVEVQGIPANDQRDRRELLLKQLNDKIDVHVAENNTGMVSVSTAGNAILVSGLDTYDLESVTDPANGKLKVSYSLAKDSVPQDVSARIKSGTIGGLLKVRDEAVEEMKGKVDILAEALVTEVNKAHVQGFDNKGRSAGNFFEISTFTPRFSENFKLSKVIAEDVSKIATAIEPGAIGDNAVAHVISSLQFKPLMEDGTASLDDYYNSQVGRVGVLTQTAMKAKEAQQALVTQLTNIRESVSGVSLDEETANMIELQRAFEASARVIKTADEMYETVLSLKRV